jgi:hypothetical protein
VHLSPAHVSHRSVPDRAKLHWDGAANYVICKPSDMRAARELPMSFISVGREVGRKKICLACSHDGIFTLKSVGISSTLPLPVQTTAPCVTNFLSSSKKKHICCHEPINALVKTAVRVPYILPSFKRQPADNKIQVALVALLAAITNK